jgi:hypothetical protein
MDFYCEDSTNKSKTGGRNSTIGRGESTSEPMAQVIKLFLPITKHRYTTDSTDKLHLRTIGL